MRGQKPARQLVWDGLFGVAVLAQIWGFPSTISCSKSLEVTRMARKLRLRIRNTYAGIVLYALLIVAIYVPIALFVVEPTVHTTPRELLPSRPDKPCVIRQESYCMPKIVTQVLHDDNNIYLMYGNIGVVQVFDLNGSYEYSIGIYKPRKHSSWLAIQDGYLYIQVNAGNLYAFQNGELQYYLSWDEAKELSESIDFADNSEIYDVRFNSIWRLEGVDSFPIVIRPFWMGFFQISQKLALVLWTAAVISFVSLFVIRKVNA